jgi:hypothetical protein
MSDNATPQESLWIPDGLDARVEVMKARMIGEGVDIVDDVIALAYSRVAFHNHRHGEWNNCSSCNSFGRVFYYTQDRRTEADPHADMWEQNLDYRFCYSCIVRKAQYRVCQRDDVSQFDFTKYEHATVFMPHALFTRDDFPISTQPEPAMCYCGEHIREGHERQGTDSNGDVLIAHSHCVTRCQVCEVNFKTQGANQVTMRVIERVTHCQDCFDVKCNDGDYSDCDRCCEWFSTDNLTWSDARERDLCNYCYREPIECRECDYHYPEGSDHECYREDGDTIYSYAYKPRPVFFGSGKYHLGFELEVEESDGDSSDNNYTASLIEGKLRNRAYMKYDGSLDAGFEVVTHPHTLEEYNSPDFDWSFLSTLVGHNYVSWNNSNCGFHVHISRKAFDAPSGYQAEVSHKMRFTKFIYDNQYQVERIAGRKANDFASFSDKGKILNKVLHNDQRNGRYEVVNVYNENTYEIRIFKGSLRKARIMSNIEFVHAVCEYTRNMKVVAKHTPFAWSRFIKFVTDNDTRYPNLMLIIDEAFASERIRSEV